MYLDPRVHQGDMSNHEKMLFWSKDTCRVKNPLDTDFTFVYDSKKWTVPANGTKDWERYLCNRYLELLSQHIIGQMILKEGQETLALLSKTQIMLLRDKYLENSEVWMKMPRIDDPELNKNIWADCFIGVIERYGEDMVEEVAPSQLSSNTTLYQKLAQDIGNKKVTDSPAAAPVQPVQTAQPTPEVATQAPTVEEVTNV